MHIKLGEDKYTYLQIERDEITRYEEIMIIKQKGTTIQPYGKHATQRTPCLYRQAFVEQVESWSKSYRKTYVMNTFIADIYF